MMKPERRFTEGLARDGRTLSGKAMPFGTIGKPGGGKPPERFEPGAFGDVSKLDVMLNRQHNRSQPIARTGSGGMELTADGKALEVRARLPKTREADDTLALVKAGVLRGLSVEFVARRERMEGGTRVIERADLVAIAVVDKPAYPAAQVSTRQADTGDGGGCPWWLL